MNQALNFIQEEKISISNCILRLDNDLNVVVLKKGYHIYYIFDDHSVAKTNTTYNEITAVQL